MDSPCVGSNGSRWSKLPSKLLSKVSKCLGFEEFQGAKSVSSPPSAPNNQIPWLILFSEKGKDYCLLFNPQEKNEVYRIQDLGDNFANSHCLAICGSWLFMRDPRCNLYIMNLLTRERIDLPSIESQFGKIKIERTIDDMFNIKIDGGYIEKHINIKFPLLWIDEQTKDYVVMWVIHYGPYLYLVYSRKGDSRWKHGNYWSSGTFVYDMVYKDHKIYLYTDSRDVKVLDFSRDIPRKIFETKVKYDYWRGMKGMPRRLNPGDVWFIKETHLVVTLSGEALRVKSIIRSDSDVWSFRIYKLDSSKRNWEKLNSLGDEAILLDLRITVLANAIEGINRNSIYFSGYRSGHERAWSEKDVFIFNLDTHEVERPHQNILSSIQSSDARWFVPNFKNEHD